MGTVRFRPLLDPDDHLLASELVFAVAAATGFYVAFHLVAAAASHLRELLALPGGLPADGLVRGTVLLVGLGLFVGGWTAWRDVEVGLAVPTRTDLSAALAALVVPATLVGLTALASEASGASYSSLARVSLAPDAPLGPFLVVTGLGLFVGVPSYLLLCQVLVQGSFRRAADGGTAVALTTATTGFLLVGTDGGVGLSAFPDRGRILGAALFAVAVGVGVYAADRADRRWVRYLAAVPAAALAATVLGSALAAVETVPGVLLAGTQLAVLGLAAAVYERTDSLAVPALAYLSFLLAHDVAVLAVEVGTLTG
jgi:hypothetical protein